MKFFACTSVIFLATSFVSGQIPASKFPEGVPVKETGIASTGGSVAGRTYANSIHKFSVNFPETWFIAGRDFEQIVKERGIDLSIDPRLGRASRRIDLLATAFRSAEEGKQGAVLRITAEDIRPHPQIRDAVDYFDAITAAFMTAKLPPDLVYSTTKAEQLGPHQFAYLDISSKAGKKRMYATVRSGFALMFTLSYEDGVDLESIRKMLGEGSFSRR